MEFVATFDHDTPFRLWFVSIEVVNFVEEGNSCSPFLSLKVISKLKGDFAAISQLRNEGNCAANGTRVPKIGFAAVKHPSKWRLGCEIPVQLCALAFK